MKSNKVSKYRALVSQNGKTLVLEYSLIFHYKCIMSTENKILEVTQ